MKKHKKLYGIVCSVFLALSTTLFIRSFSTTTAWLNSGTSYYAWQTITLTYTAQNFQVDPLDYTTVNFSAQIRHSDGKGLMNDTVPSTVYGYWDGGNTWRIRFTPTRSGLWTITTSFDAPTADNGLDNKTSTVTVLPPHSSSPQLFKVGGFLQSLPATNVSRGWLGYSNNSPFFWLAYKAHAMYGTDGTLNDYRTIISNAANRGFTVYQFSGLNQKRSYPSASGTIVGNVYTFAATSTGLSSANPNQVRAARQYWDELDHIIRFGAQSGLVAAIGIGSYETFESYTLEEQKRVWAYLQARLGSYPITSFFAQEYNSLHKPASSDLNNPCKPGETFVMIGNLRRCAFSQQHVQNRIDDFFELVQFFNDRDPYNRALTLHSAVLDQSLCGGENTSRRSCTLPVEFKNYQDWFSSAPTDFIMIQVGHRILPKPTVFSDMTRVMDLEQINKPFIIDEFNYEGFADEAVVSNRNGTCSYTRKGKRFVNASGTLLPLDTTQPYILTDEGHIRNSMLVSMQTGAAGYTYAAQGVYAMILDKYTNPKTTANWGPALNWTEGLQLSGGRYLQFIRAIMHRYPIQSYLPDSAVLMNNLGSTNQSMAVNSRLIGQNKAFLISYIAPVQEPCLPTNAVDRDTYLRNYYAGYYLKNLRVGSTYVGRFMSTRSNTQWEQVYTVSQNGELVLPNIASLFTTDYSKLLNYDMVLHLESVESAKGLRPFLTAYNTEIDRYAHTTHPETVFSIFAQRGYEQIPQTVYIPMYTSFIPRTREYSSRTYTEFETSPMWQLFNRSQNIHRFVIKSQEYDALIADGWEDNGIKGYVFTQAGYRREKMLRLIPPIDDGSRHYILESDWADFERQDWTKDETFGEAFVVVDPLDA
jgi:Protein of unknown function (DUF4038)/Domain of unknown function (DUF5060)